MGNAGGIFVTGATGALGPALLAELLATGRPVIALVRPGRSVCDARVKTVEGDVTRGKLPIDPRDLDGIEVIVHAAAARMGAIHHALRWLHRGLIPMLPGSEQTPVDLISTDLAARCVARCATAVGSEVPDVIQVAAGANAVPLGQLLDFIVEQFRDLALPWRQGQLRRPMVVDRATFEMFQQSVRQSGDVLFRTVLDSTAAFLPALLHPKVYQTTRAEALMGGPLPLGDWRDLLR